MPIKLTESHLRKIIREELIREVDALASQIPAPDEVAQTIYNHLGPEETNDLIKGIMIGEPGGDDTRFLDSLLTKFVTKKEIDKLGADYTDYFDRVVERLSELLVDAGLRKKPIRMLPAPGGTGRFRRTR